MISKIVLTGMRFYSFHGVGSQEKVVGNHFIVSLSITAPLEKAVHSDDLNDTISYAEVCSIVKAEMDIPSRLMEHAAGRIIQALKKRFPQIKDTELSISKLNPPISGDIPSASIVLRETYP
ncbi:MAG: dihydroneopterin aldolase [Tannerellaceae bacterium]|jgi:dihydroneopterin aldolase|nr:dihydroneopterin aldolase [Tannerellaceae bacterium]